MENERIINYKPLITVIVPVYNVEAYVRKCIESIMSQTYENIEILLIDDGTPDNSGRICDEYAEIDKRIKVYHKANGGLSDARNYGVDRASGEYLTFVDSDDYLDKDYVEFLYNLVSRGYKLALCSLRVRFLSNGRVCDKGNGNEMIIPAKQCLEMLCYHCEVDTAAYGKLIHRDLFKNVRFPKGKLFEDIATMYLIIDKCEYIICSFKPKYNYVIREESIVTSEFTERKLDLIEMTDKMADYVDQKYPDLWEATLRRRGYARFSTLNQMLDVKSDKEKQIRDEIIVYLKKISQDVLRNKKVPNRDKIAYCALNCGFSIYRILWRMYVKYQRG